MLSKPIISAEDLRIEAKLEGVELVGQGGGELLYGDAETSNASIRVGKVVMVDSVGQRNELTLTADGNTLHIDVPSRLLAAAVYPVAIDPVVGPAFQLAYNPDDNDAHQPWVTANGTNYFVVWTDGRNVGSSSDWDIYGARVTTAGAVLDPAGIAICTGNSTQLGPQAASVGGSFLVVWSDWRNQFTTDSDIYAATVTGSGVASASFAVCDLHAVQEVPTVAANGTNYLVVWTDDRVRTNGSRNIFANRISASGTPLDGDGFEVYRGGFDYEWDPSVASDGSNFMVVWTDFDPSHYGVFGRPVSSTGTTGSVFTVCANASSPSIAWSATATNYMVGFNNSAVSVNRISQNGIPLDGSSGFTIVSNSNVGSISVACNGTNYLVGWTDEAAYGTFVRASDGALGATVEISARGQQENEICVANLGSDFLAVWSENNDFEFDPAQDYEVWGALITESASKLVFPLSTSGTISGAQTYMSAATSGSEYLLAWTDTRNTNSDIFAARVTTSGLVLDPGGIPIATGSSSQQHPSLAFAGSHYLIAWRDGITGVDASRIATDGTVVDTIAVTSSNVTEYPGVAAAGTNFLVTWSLSTNIYAARITSGGLVLDTNGAWIASSGFTFPNPWPAGVGNDWLIAWSGTANIFAARFTAAGAVLDTPALMLNAPTNGTGGNPRVPRVSGNGTNFLVVWQQSASSQGWNVYGARISPGGSVLDSTPISVCATTNSQMFPSVASDGSSFFVAWADSRSTPGRLYGARVNNDGLVLDTNGFLVSADNPAFSFGGYIGLASASQGRYLFAYPSTSTHASRVLIVNTQ